MERHIIYEMLQGKDITIPEKDKTHFSFEFLKQYKLLQTMKELQIDIDKKQFLLFASIEDKKIDVDFARKLEIEDFDEAYKLFIQTTEQVRDIKSATNILQAFDITKPEDIEKAKKHLDNFSLRNSSVKVYNMEEAKKLQLEFLNNIFEGKEVDGIYLYSYLRKTSKQFMKLNFLLKYFARTDLTLIGGRPSVGKTSFLLAMLNVLGKQGYKGLFFSLEMTAAEVMHRFAIAKSGITNNDLFDTRDMDEKKTNYINGMEEIQKIPLKIIDEGITNWLAIKNVIIKNKDNIDYVAIDHLTYMSSYDGIDMGEGHALYSKIVRDMKQTCKEYNIPIFLLAQLNRSVSQGQKGKKLDDRYYEIFMRDFRESGSLEEYADKILLLYRLEDKQEMFEKYNVYKVACKVEKNRSGRNGIVKYYFRADRFRWEEFADDDK